MVVKLVLEPVALGGVVVVDVVVVAVLFNPANPPEPLGAIVLALVILAAVPIPYY